ncbi:MAG: serpin family protein [Oscillospiraceae bacterium]|nr:serpin family protein [Oscillospiraceae bacterium]
MKKFLALFMAAAMLFTGCSKSCSLSENLAENITPCRVAVPAEDTGLDYLYDFSGRLFGRCTAEDANTLVSPFSVAYALAMTANGAQQATKEQMEAVLGADTEKLNTGLKAYMDSLQENSPLAVANAIWYRDSFVPQEEFLQTAADYYTVGLYRAPFDRGTVKDINSYVKQHTNGMIDRIIDKIDRETVMFLVNALCFESKWHTEYEKRDIWQEDFTSYNGEKQSADFMHSAERHYFETGSATGFAKYYEGGRYAFVGILPREGTDIVDWCRSFDGTAIENILGAVERKTVNVSIPEFTTDFSAQLNDVLKSMGMERAFDKDKADLGAMGSSDTNLYIGTVAHKTHITVDRAGTKAAAVTLVGVDCTSCVEEPEEIKEVRLDRPFVYMIADMDAGLPLFVGNVLEIQ